MRELHRTRRALLVLLSAALYGLVFPPWNLAVLAWVALVPLLIALRGVRPRAGFVAGLLWGVAMIWCIGSWLPLALSDYYQQPLWFGLAFAFGASIYFIGLYHAAFGASAAWFGARTGPWSRMVLLAALWVAWELVKSRFLTGDPWLLLGYALAGSPSLAQLADLGGVYLLSFVLALVNAGIAEALLSSATPMRRLALLALPALVLVADYAYGRHRLDEDLPKAPLVPVTIVQGNNDVGAQWRREFFRKGLDTYLMLSAEAGPRHESRLIIWPESAVTFFLADEANFQRPIARMLAEADADLIVGGPFQEAVAGEKRFYNSAFYFSADRQIVDRYDKRHLMPFAEYFPLRTIELLRRRFERVPYFTPGSGDEILDTRFGKVATVICFEGMYPEIVRAQMRRGAGLLVNLSNDAWLGSGAGPEQHLLMIVLRAIENRVWVIRSTTTGVSALIDPHGRIAGRTGQDVVAVLRGAVVPMQIDTVYKRVGDVFAWACLALVLIATPVVGFAAKSRGPAPAPADPISRRRPRP